MPELWVVIHVVGNAMNMIIRMLENGVLCKKQLLHHHRRQQGAREGDGSADGTTMV